MLLSEKIGHISMLAISKILLKQSTVGLTAVPNFLINKISIGDVTRLVSLSAQTSSLQKSFFKIGDCVQIVLSPFTYHINNEGIPGFSIEAILLSGKR